MPLVVVGLGTLAVLTMCALRRPAVRPEEGREIAAAFLDDLRNNRIDAAWEGTTAEFKSFLGRERLHTLVRTHAVLRAPTEFSGFKDDEANGIPVMVYTFWAATASASIQVLLAREQGQWKVERLTVE